MPFWYKPLMCRDPSTKKWVRIPTSGGLIVVEADNGAKAEKEMYDKFYRKSGVWKRYFRLCSLGARGPHGTKEEARKSFFAELAGKTKKPKNEKTEEPKNR